MHGTNEVIISFLPFIPTYTRMHAYLTYPAYRFAAYGMQTTQHPCVTVIDSGYSFTHIVPTILGNVSPLPRAIPPCIRRIDIGGKALTNYLMELVSYRSLDLSTEPWVVEKMKEDVCFVATDCAQTIQHWGSGKKGARIRMQSAEDGDGHISSTTGASGPPLATPTSIHTPATTAASALDRSASSLHSSIPSPPSTLLALDYVLPDFGSIPRGRVRIPSDPSSVQAVTLSTERCWVPELLFKPNIVGMFFPCI